MKHELELKVQAWLDGELADREARRMGEWIARDPEAAALAAELGCVRQALFRQETPGSLGESREFYWSKIQRQIERESSLRRAERRPWFARWHKYMAPLTGVAALAFVLLMAVVRHGSQTFDEVSSTGAGMEAVTFHDQSAQMTVVWLQDNSPATADPAVKKSIQFEDEPGTVIDLQ
jgi:anti-sigma factor RsiW